MNLGWPLADHKQDLRKHRKFRIIIAPDEPRG